MILNSVSGNVGEDQISFCSQCGAKAFAGAKYCHDCGKPLSQQESANTSTPIAIPISGPASQASTRTTRKDHLREVIGWGIRVLGILAILVLWAMWREIAGENGIDSGLHGAVRGIAMGYLAYLLWNKTQRKAAEERDQSKSQSELLTARIHADALKLSNKRIEELRRSQR